MKKISAFTLIEITISLTVFFIIITIILSTSKNIFLNQKEISTGINQKQNVAKLLTTITAQIKSIYLHKDFPLNGDKNKINFYTLNSKDTNIPLNLEYYNANQDIICKTNKYLIPEEKKHLVIENMQLSFSYLNKDNIFQETILKNDEIKAIKITLNDKSSFNFKEFSHIIYLNRN